MNKMNEGSLNESAISLAALKQSAQGDSVVVLTCDGQPDWLEVVSSVAVRGCKGGTTITLRSMATGEESTHLLRSELPTAFSRVRRVSAGVNARTTRRLAPVAQPAPAVVQPEGEFENILDVPEAPESIETVAETTDAAVQPEPLAEVGETSAETDAAVG